MTRTWCIYYMYSYGPTEGVVSKIILGTTILATRGIIRSFSDIICVVRKDLN